jgi:N-acetylmuramoyl-L-alanine amidase
MQQPAVFPRRFLLGAGISATIALPLWMQAGLARAATRGGHRPPVSPAAARDLAARRLVVLDPGHGGKDPGCIGAGAVYEKDIVLDVGLDLRKALERGGHEVLMTRTADVFIPLQGRVDFAERHRATLFLSVHANAVAHDPAVHGASVFTFSPDASDPLAREIADDENAVQRISDPRFKGVSPQVGKILFSLMSHSTRIQSALLQRNVVDALARDVPMLQNPARHASFAVLQSAAIPSVLVETAFLSNPRDEAELRTYAFRMRLAEAIKTAVDAWFAARKYAIANL